MFAAFEKLIDPYPKALPAQPPTGLWAFCLHYSRPFLPLLVAMSVLTTVISVLEIVFFAFVGNLVDWLASADRATFFTDHGWRLGGMAAVIIIVFPLAMLVHSLLLHQSIYGNFPMLVRWKAHRYMLGQSIEFFSNEFAGRVSQKVMQTSLSVRETVLKLLDVLVYVSVYFLGTVAFVGAADLWLVVPLIGWLAAYFVILIRFVPQLRDISKVQADARAHMTGRVVDGYTNIQTIKLFAHSRREVDYARGAMDEFMVTVHKQMRLVTQLIVWLNIANSLLLVSITAVAIYGWQQNVITLGAIAVAIGLVMRIRNMSEWVLWEIAALFENIGTVQDGINTIAQPVGVKDKPEAGDLEVERGEICFDHARFHYGRRTKVIEDFFLDIRPGEKVGLVGRSGAGKSTLVNLLLRFYDLEGGRILIDGQNIADVSQESLRRQVGMVTQDTSLLHRSVRDNITYGRPLASEDEIVEATRKAEADVFITELADMKDRTGLDAHVGERGVKLSGGQRQRIAIARVLLKDAPILILDEATSALDSEVEAAIQQSLFRLMQGKTVIAIAHRLSTIAAMDRLVVLDQGRIVETGTHEHLLRQGGIYAQLWKHQSGGFLDPELPQAVA
ncbi:MAG: ABC transporter ATP-binding protein [Hyphomicrobiales bacterium]|nr:ABC transporter ATP-binding protein [Hyphomicrobiales bacterium]